MAVLSIRDFPQELLNDLHAQSERAGMTLRGFVIKRLKGERGIAAGVSVFQTDDAGSTPAVRSISYDASESQESVELTPEQKRAAFQQLKSRFGS